MIFDKNFKKKIKKGMYQGGFELQITFSKGISICWLLISGIFWFFLIHTFSLVFFRWFSNLAPGLNEANSINTFLGMVSLIYFAYVLLRVVLIIVRKEVCEVKLK